MAGDPARAAHLLQTYADATRAELARLEQAPAGDRDALARIAHNMRGAAQFIGAIAVALAAERLEDAPDAGAAAAALRELQRVAAEAVAWAQRENQAA